MFIETPEQHAACKGVEGLGDTVARLAHATGLDRAAKAYERVTGRPCGCGGRRRWLNKRFPSKDSEQGT